MHVLDKLLELNSILMSLGVGGIIGAAVGVINSVQKNKQMTEQRFELLESANVAILHNEIYKQCSMFIDEGEISIDDLDNLEYLWNGYHGLGGNGTGELLYNRVKNLPIKGEK